MGVQCEFHGICRAGGLPIFIREVPIVHALDVVYSLLSRPGAATSRLENGETHAGDGAACGRRHSWFLRGDWRFQYAIPSNIASPCETVAEALPFPLSLFRFSTNRPVGKPPPKHLDARWTVLEGARLRAGFLLGGGLFEPRLDRLPFAPLISEEIRVYIKYRGGKSYTHRLNFSPDPPHS